MIRTLKTGNQIEYSAKDIFEQLGLNWRGVRSIPENIIANYNTIDGVNQYTLKEREIKKLCSHFKKPFEALAIGIAPTKKDKKVDALESTVKDLKLVVAKLLTQGNDLRKSLPVKGTSAKILKLDPLQVQARKQIRELVQEYASLRANELGIRDEGRRIFFDLSFKALYDAYKDKTPNKLDLKALADEETNKTGNKVSGLQIAEKLGIAVELLQFTKSFYRI